jgi:hypothetical protein
MTSAHLSRAALGGIVAAVCLAPAAHGAVTISSAATSNMSCTSGVCSPAAATAVLNVGDLTTMLASGNVTVNTGTGSLAAQVEDIVVAAGFNWTSANALTLDAYRSVTVTAPVADNGSGAVSLVTNDGGSGGYLLFVSGGSLSFLGTANSLSINGAAYTLESTIADLAAAIRHKASGYYALSASYDAGRDRTYKAPPIKTKFKGTFTGLGNTISNLKITCKNTETGLFAYVDTNGSINSLSVAGASIKALDSAERSGSVAGVIAAANFGSVFNSFATGSIHATFSQYPVLVGGLVGSNLGSIFDSAASTTAVAVGKKGGQAIAAAGGLAGRSDGTIGSSFATGNASITGRAAATYYVGGLVGLDNGPVENGYAEGAVAGENTSAAGGLAGGTDSPISGSYSTGSVTAGNGSDIGGLVGFDSSHGGLSNNYWDTSTSGVTNLSQGAGTPANDPGITGETTAQLQAALPAGFDPTIWAESPTINGGLPYLIANPPQ